MTNITDEQMDTFRPLLNAWMKLNEMEFDIINFCPVCGSKVMYYHGAGFTQIICSEKCQGMKVLKTIER